MFVMGMIAGILQKREGTPEPQDKGLLHDIFPWSQVYHNKKEPSQQNWQRRVDRSAMVLLTVIIFSVAKSKVPWLPRLNSQAQIVTVHLQLIMIVGLCNDCSGSVCKWLCTSKILMLLGNYSLQIYVLHDPVLKFFIFWLLWDQEQPWTLLAAAGATLTLAILLTHLVEKPIRRWKSSSNVEINAV